MAQFRFSTDDESSFFSFRLSSLEGWWEMNKKGEIKMFEIMHEKLAYIKREELNQYHREQIHDIDEIINDIWNMTDDYGCSFELLNDNLNHIKIDIFIEVCDGEMGLIYCDGQAIQCFGPSAIRILLTHLISNGFLIVNY